MAMQRLTYVIDKKTVTVFVEYKNNRNMYLRIKKGQIYCTAPSYTSDIEIKEFISKYVRKLNQTIKHHKNNEKYSLTYDFLFFKGRKYFFKRLAGFNTESVEIYLNTLYIKTSDSSDFSVKDAIVKFLIKESHKYFEVNLKIWEDKMNLQGHSYQLIKRKNVWAYNLVNKRIIKFNYSLLYFNSSVIDYVIVHELAHTIHPNHSPLFWDLIEKYIYNYKDIKMLLKNYGYSDDL